MGAPGGGRRGAASCAWDSGRAAEVDRLAQEQARRRRTVRAANTRLKAAMDPLGGYGPSEPAPAL